MESYLMESIFDSMENIFNEIQIFWEVFYEFSYQNIS